MTIRLERSTRDFIAELKQLIALTEDILHMHCHGVAVRTMLHVDSLRENDQVDVTLALAPTDASAAMPLVPAISVPPLESASPFSSLPVVEQPPAAAVGPPHKRTHRGDESNHDGSNSRRDEEDATNAAVDADIAAASALPAAKRVKQEATE